MAAGFPFDGDHRVREFRNDLLLLGGCEDFLDQLYLNQWHCFSSLIELVVDQPAPVWGTIRWEPLSGVSLSGSGALS